MPMYDFKCINDKCGWSGESLQKMGIQAVTCPKCSHPAERCTMSMCAASVVSDSIPGGMWLENYGPHPVKVTSHTERIRLMKARGLEPMIRHVGIPGTDKSPHTSNWAAVSRTQLENATAMLERIHPDSDDRDEHVREQTFQDSTIHPFNEFRSRKDVIEIQQLARQVGTGNGR